MGALPQSLCNLGVDARVVLPKHKNIKADYIYFADNLNNPYGIKTKNEIKNITKNNVRKIIEMGVDIIVIACNTATSVAIEELRGIYKDKYIIGTEPAVKVAADKNIENKSKIGPNNKFLKSNEIWIICKKSCKIYDLHKMEKNEN